MMEDEDNTTTNNAIVTVSELIDNAFGDPKVNVVHHKQIQTILYLLARQLRVLERRVEVKLAPSQLAQKRLSTLSVTEVKIQTKTESKTAISTDAKKTTKGRKSKDEKRTTEGDTESATGKDTLREMKLDKNATANKPSIFEVISDTKEATTTGKNLTEKATKDRLSSPSISQSRKFDPQDYQTRLNEVEEARERELRVIHQRADSREEHEKTPTPIASMDSVEATLEKILVVERVPVEEATARAVRAKSGTKEQIPQISVVTQEQFKALANLVDQLLKKFHPVGNLAFPDNSTLMEDLRKGASLTEAMAALQLSARLEAAEKTLKNLLAIITNMATQIPGFEFDAIVENEIETDKNKVGKDSKQTVKTKSAKMKTGEAQSRMVKLPSKESIAAVPTQPLSMEDTTRDEVLYDEFRKEMQELRDKIMKQVTQLSNQNADAAETALKIARKLEAKIDKSLQVNDKMEKLESLVASYVDQINSVDTGLSSQLTNYQEELTQMQHDLESGLETMADALANSGGDATAITELNGHFNDLQMDIDDTVIRQNELREVQHNMSLDLHDLRIQIEMLRDIKADRDEVADALRDKAGLSDLNGLLTFEQFEAVSGDLEARIAAAFDKFNNQEHVWQRAIDDMLAELGEKADLVQVESLRDEFNRYLEILRKRMKDIYDIVGEPVAAALSRKLHRDATCLSCAAAAYMNVEQTTMPKLPAVRPKTVGAEAEKPKGDGDGYELCYPGRSIKHPIDPRAHMCNRWCGGSHTLINSAKNRDFPNVTSTPFRKSVTLKCGTDGKMYAVDEKREPCKQCLAPAPIHSPVAPELNHEDKEIDSLDMMPYDLQQTFYNAYENETPPAGLNH